MTGHRDDITVLVENSGRVFVNELLVAEVAVGVVEGRDTLTRDLTLHRVADRILHRITDIEIILDDAKKKPSLELAEGWLDGFRGVTKTIGESTEIPPKDGFEYRAGYGAGRYLAAMGRFLAETKAGIEP